MSAFGLVTGVWQAWLDAGFIEGDLVLIVREGKIQSYTFTMSPESLAKFPPQPESLAETGGSVLPAYALVTVLGMLIVTSGLGMETLRRHSLEL